MPVLDGGRRTEDGFTFVPSFALRPPSGAMAFQQTEPFLASAADGSLTSEDSMRRSSWLILSAALALLAVIGLFYRHSFNTIAPPMTPEAAHDFLERGKAAMERRDTNAIIALFAPGARI